MGPGCTTPQTHLKGWDPLYLGRSPNSQLMITSPLFFYFCSIALALSKIKKKPGELRSSSPQAEKISSKTAKAFFSLAWTADSSASCRVQ